MNCGQFRQFYSDFTDGQLDEADEVAFHVHMAECMSCQRFDAALEQGRVALRRMKSPPPSGNFEARLHDRIRKECAAAAELPALRQFSGFAGAVLIVAVIGVAGWHARAALRAAPAALRGSAGMTPSATQSFIPRFAGDTTIRYVGRIPVIPVSRDTNRAAARASRGTEITVDWMP
jgi:anti-sigma factor RsiW